MYQITRSKARWAGGYANAVTPDETAGTPVVFSAGIPNGVLLSRLTDPRNVPRQWRLPTPMDGWCDAMRKEMEKLQSHDVYELVPRAPGMRTL